MEHEKELLYSIESKLLSIFMRSNTAKSRISESLISSDFFSKKHQVIYQGINNLFKNNKLINDDILAIYLHNNKKLDEAGGKNYITSLYNDYIGDSFYSSYIEYISEFSKKIKLKSLSDFILIQLEMKDNKSNKILEATQQKISELFNLNSDVDFMHINELTLEMYKNIERLSQLKSIITGTSSGYHDLDSLTDGFHPGELVILAARPSMGKTAFALNIVANIINENVKLDKIKQTSVAFFSLEMPNIQLMSRLASIIGAISLKKVSTGKNLTEHDWTKLEFINKLSNKIDVYFNDSSTVNISKLNLKLKNLCKINPNVKLVIIDYLQLLSSSENVYNQSRVNEVSKISRSLKVIARELKITIICLSQLSRGVESREDKRPVMSDLRDSGSIEQDADVVLLLYRELYYQKMSKTHQKKIGENSDFKLIEGQDVAEIILAKNRNGPIGKIYLQFDSDIGKFIRTKQIIRKGN